MYLLYINTLCRRSWLSATPENGHLQLGMAIGSILLISGSFNRRVLYYNVYILYYTLLYQNQFIYFTILYNTTLQYYTMYCKNTKYTVYPRMFLLQLFASVHLAHSTVQIEFLGGFFSAPCHYLGQKNNKDCQPRLESVYHGLQVWGRLQGI